LDFVAQLGLQSERREWTLGAVSFKRGPFMMLEAKMISSEFGVLPLAAQAASARPWWE
jgi:hypothetical protein